MSFKLASPAFSAHEKIPRAHAHDGENVSPPLVWCDPPQGTRSFALIVEDPDAPAGTFRHWAVFNVAANRHGFPEGGRVSEGEQLNTALNDFGNPQYDGPERPVGDRPHRYHFRLAALDVDQITPPVDANAAEIWSMARPHIIAETELIGIYSR